MAIKEIKVRPQTDEVDYDHKLKGIIRFLDKGDQVKLEVRLRGRELGHKQLGIALLASFVKDLEQHGKAEWPPIEQERLCFLVFSPKA